MKEILFNSYFPVFSIGILLVVLLVITFALFKTYKYFIERFPRDAEARGRFVEFSAKAEEAQKRYEALLSSYDEIKKEIQKTIEDARENIIDQAILDKTNKELAIANDDLQKVKEDFLDCQAKSNEEKQKLESIKEKKLQIEEDKKNLESQYEEIQNKLDELKQHPNLEKIDELKNQLNEIEEKLSSKKIDLETVTSRYNSTNEKYSSLDNEYKLKKQSLESELAQKKEFLNKEYGQKKNSLEDSIEQIKKELTPLQKTLDEKNRKSSELDEKIISKTIELNFLKNKCSELSASVSENENKQLRYDDLLKIPDNLKSVVGKTAFSDGLDENKMLDEFEKYLKDHGYTFSRDVINAFHTSLKIQDINPLTVLAGISGTGKTLLPRMYSEFFGFYRLVIPVQPRWDSPQDLLGFYNYLEKKYQSTELARALVYFDGTRIADKEIVTKVKDRMMMVLLDEMNLARTEYYFSEFLSRLELRRNVNNDHDKEGKKDSEILIDNDFGSVYVPQNVLFVGTMNEDESTQTLSDKVLDRANLLRFGKPNNTDKKEKSNPQHLEKVMSKKLWDSWCKKEVKQNEKIEKIIKDLNAAMNYIGRPFGYRVSDAIMAYVNNYPKSNEEKNEKQALSDQIEQKILPKLRGCDLHQDSTEKCMQKIKDIISDLGNEPLSEAFNKASDGSVQDMFVWQGISR